MNINRQSDKKENDNPPESDSEDIFAFPAVITFEKKFGHKVNKKTGKTRVDKLYEKSALTHSLYLQRVCYCFLSEEEFFTLEFDKMVSQGLELLPGVALSFAQREEMGQPYVYFSMDDIIDYKIITGFSVPQFCVNTINRYVFIFPVSGIWIEYKRKNKDLIIQCQEYYESIGIKSKKGPGLRSKYDDPFSGYMNDLFKQKERSNIIKRKPNYYIPFCPTHKRTGRFLYDHNKFYCQKCDDFIK